MDDAYSASRLNITSCIILKKTFANILASESLKKSKKKVI